MTHCVKSKEINLSPLNWLPRLTHKERLSALEFVPRYVYFPACAVSMRTIRDCNASALIPARKSSIAVLFDFLTKCNQPDQGGTHEGFLRLKDSYDRAMAAFRHAAA